jgi:hypothetical protein
MRAETASESPHAGLSAVHDFSLNYEMLLFAANVSEREGGRERERERAVSGIFRESEKERERRGRRDRRRLRAVETMWREQRSGVRKSVCGRRELAVGLQPGLAFTIVTIHKNREYEEIYFL